HPSCKRPERLTQSAQRGNGRWRRGQTRGAIQTGLYLGPIESRSVARRPSERGFRGGTLARGLFADTVHQRFQVEVRAGRRGQKLVCLVHLPPLISVERNRDYAARAWQWPIRSTAARSASTIMVTRSSKLTSGCQ